MNLDRKLGKSSGQIPEQTGAKSCLPVHSSTALKVDRSSWRAEDSENRSQSLKEQNLRLTEAMRKLTASGVRKIRSCDEFGPRIDSSCLMNANLHSALFSRWKPHIVAQITPKEVSAAGPPNPEHGGRRRQSLTGTESSEMCTNAHLLASDPEPSNHTTSRLVVSTPSLCCAEQVVKTELSPRTTGSDGETTVSPLQFGTDTKWGQPAAVKDTE